ncbi:MAG: DUF1883 domain-containing protein [Ktedonobacteraceae bacterium]
MDHLLYEFSANAGDIVEVTLDHQANVLLLDSSDYSSYKNRRQFRYYGGLAKRSPFRITVPSSGSWYVVVDLGGYAGRVQCSFRVLRLLWV